MFSPIVLRRIALLLLLAFGNLIAQPVIAAINTPATPRSQSERMEAQQGRQLDDLRERLQQTQAKRERGQSVDTDITAILRAGASIEAEAEAVDTDFANIETHLKTHHLPQEILERHHAAVADYHSKRTEFRQRLNALQTARNSPTQRDQALSELNRFMQATQKQRTHTVADPHNLPFRTPKGHIRPPIETQAAYRSSLFKPAPIHVASNGSLSGITLPEAALPATPNAQDLAATEDIQLTDAIRAKAQELGNNPVNIHNWVRNSIEFIPSYGSIQGSDMTLQSQRGNAFDTASLEIALLRAAGIPARYVYGTIQLPVDNVMNWVGGVSTPEAAQSLLGQGGIPNIGILSGGKVASIRMEHVWVEAWVDYIPSRGAVNKIGDTWIPLDASYKQYRYTPGMDIQGNVPINAQNLLDQIKQGATVNESEGWVQNLNSANIQSALTTYQNQVKTYVDTTKPNATVGDVLGSKTIVQQSPPILMGSLPYTILAEGNRMDSLPDSLQWRFRTELTDTYGTSLVSLDQNTATLAGKKITLSFIPATQADTDLINSYLPQPHADGTPIQPSELPSSLPGYLIHLKAEIRVDGQMVMQGGNLSMGQELRQASAMFNPGSGQWEEGEINKPIAGEYHAIGLDLQGIATSQLQTLQSRLQQTKAKLEQYQQNPNDPAPIQNLSKEDLSGDLLYSGILGYFASLDANDQLAARTSGNIVAYRLPSYGAFSATAQPHYWYGIVRSVSFPGVSMDVDRIAMHVESKDSDKVPKLAYMKQVGAASSAFEHAVPERLFADPTKPLDDPSQPQGVSAVKAIAIAASQGQKIYTLTAHNAAFHANILASLDTNENTKTEIRNALSAGMEVTVHQSDISVSGWTGSGYIILDPETGAGAYKISGGMNGGWLSGLDNNAGIIGLLAAMLGSLTFTTGFMPFLIPLLAFTIAAALFTVGLIMFLDSMDGGPCDAGAFTAYIALGIVAVTLGVLMGSLGTVVIALWFSGFLADGAIRSVFNNWVGCRA